MRNLDKKTLYRQIVKFQNFAHAWNAKKHCTDSTLIFECTCIGSDVSGHQRNEVTFLLSKEDLPDMDNLSKEIIKANYYDIHLMSNNDIKSYIFQCKEYGIYVAEL